MIALWCVLSFLGGGLIVFLYHRSQLSLVERNNRQLQDELRESARIAREEGERQWQLKFDKMKEEFVNMSNSLLKQRETSLQSSNREQIEQLLQPVREQFVAFQKAVNETRTANEVAKKQLENAFESTLKLFAVQQKSAVDALREQTMKIGNDAANLSRILKNNSKVQGDWGEMILDSLLESSGLVKNEQYFVQENVKDESGRNFRPDVIVRFPEGKSVVIDSKVSLKAYAEAFETEDEEERKRKLKEHARSVRKHVDELYGKRYEKMVERSMEFVLMFIPNDQSYLYAISEERDLIRYAYSKGVVIISPSNLMIALQLTFNIWQQERQSRNLEEIVKTATDLYEKGAGFSETMENVELQIKKLSAEFDKAKNQLYEGKGNLLRRLESLKDMGISPKKQIRSL